MTDIAKEMRDGWALVPVEPSAEMIAVYRGEVKPRPFHRTAARVIRSINGAASPAVSLSAILSRLEAAERERDEAKAALEAISTWADQRCPCTNEQPNPCPLCMADANNPQDICLSAENTLPRHILRRVRLALGSRALAKETAHD